MKSYKAHAIFRLLSSKGTCIRGLEVFLREYESGNDSKMILIKGKFDNIVESTNCFVQYESLFSCATKLEVEINALESSYITDKLATTRLAEISIIDNVPVNDNKLDEKYLMVVNAKIRYQQVLHDIDYLRLITYNEIIATNFCETFKNIFLPVSTKVRNKKLHQTLENEKRQMRFYKKYLQSKVCKNTFAFLRTLCELDYNWLYEKLKKEKQ